MTEAHESLLLDLLRDGTSLSRALKRLDITRPDFGRYCVENYAFTVAVTAAKRRGRVRSGREPVIRGDEVVYLPDSMRP